MSIFLQLQLPEDDVNYTLSTALFFVSVVTLSGAALELPVLIHFV